VIEHLFLLVALIAAIALAFRLRALRAQNAKLVRAAEEVRAENSRLESIVSPLRAIPEELADMLARASAEGMVAEAVTRDARAILERRLDQRSPELTTLKQRLGAAVMPRGTLGPVAAAEVPRIELELAAAKGNGYNAVLIAEFEYGKHPRLGSVDRVDSGYHVPPGWERWTYTGPIKQIVEYLENQGLEVRVQTELRYVNHPRGGGGWATRCWFWCLSAQRAADFRRLLLQPHHTICCR
jgi:hypothetical protein